MIETLYRPTENIRIQTSVEKICDVIDAFMKKGWQPAAVALAAIAVAYVCSLSDSVPAAFGESASTLVGAGVGGLTLTNSAKNFVGDGIHARRIRRAGRNIEKGSGISERQLKAILGHGKIPVRREIRKWTKGRIGNSDSRSRIVYSLAEEQRKKAIDLEMKHRGKKLSRKQTLLLIRTVRAEIVTMCDTLVKTEEEKSNPYVKPAIYAIGILGAIAVAAEIGAFDSAGARLWSFIDDIPALGGLMLSSLFRLAGNRLRCAQEKAKPDKLIRGGFICQEEVFGSKPNKNVSSTRPLGPNATPAHG